MAARPWENRVFDTTSVSKDVFDSYSVKSADNDHYTPKKAAGAGEPRLSKQSSSHQNGQAPPNSTTLQIGPTSLRIENNHSANHDPRPNGGPAMSAPHGNGHGHAHSHYNSPSTMKRTSSQGAPNFHPPVTLPSAYKTSTPVLIRSASPRSSIRREDIEEGGSTVSTTARSMVSGPRYGTRSVISRDDESLASSPSVPNYMQATQSAKAKVRSHSTPKQRPGTPEKDTSWAPKKRLSLPIAENLINSSGPIVLRPFRPTPYAQRSPSLRTDRGNDQRSEGDATPASSEVSGARGLYR